MGAWPHVEHAGLKKISSTLGPALAVGLGLFLFASCVSGGGPGASGMLRPDQGEPIFRVDPHGHMADIQKVMFTRDGRFLVSAADDKTMRVWDVETGRCERTILGQIDQSREGRIYAAALSPDDRILAAAGWLGPSVDYRLTELGRIRLHDFETGRVQAVLQGHRDVVNVLEFSPDGRWLASGSHDQTVRVWNAAQGFRIEKVLEGHTEHVYALDFSPGGDFLVTAGDDGELRLWRTADWSLVGVLKGHGDKVRAVRFSPDGRFIVSGSWDRTVKVWDGRTGGFIKDLVQTDNIPNAVVFTPDGSKIICGSYKKPHACRVYSFPEGRRLTGYDRHDNNVWAVAVSPDGRLAATGGGNDFPIHLWSLESGKTVRLLTGAGAAVWNVGFSRDGSSIGYGNEGREDDRVTAGPLTGSIELKRAEQCGISLGGAIEDQSLFRTAVHDIGTLRLTAAKGGDYGVNAALRVEKDGQTLTEIQRDSSTGYAHLSYTFTPDGRNVISGGFNGSLIAYRVGDGKKIAEFYGHEAEVYAVAVSPDGRRLVSGSKDQTIRLWSLDGLGEQEAVAPLLSFFVGRDNEWVAWTNRGYYAGSLRGDEYVGWHVNHGPDGQAEFFPAERFMLKFYRPDVVAAILRYNDLDRAVAEANRYIPTEARVRMSEILPPQVTCVEPGGLVIETDQPRLKIRGLAKSVNGLPVAEFRVLHNGRPLAYPALELKGRPLDKEQSILQEVVLEPGVNTLTLTAANSVSRSNPQNVTVIFVGKPEVEISRKPNLNILAVGISDYLDDDLDLTYADKDAEAVSELLIRQRGGHYNQVKILMLTNKQATRDGIVTGLGWLSEKVDRQDIAVLFVAGHGLNDPQGQYHFLSHDARIGERIEQAVDWTAFKKTITHIPCKVVLLVDTCHAGNITGSSLDPHWSNTDVTGALKQITSSHTDVLILSATTGEGYSQESPEWEHGVFTKAVLDGFQGQADYNRDGTVDVMELNLFVNHKVVELTGGSQRPTVEIPSSMTNFQFVKVVAE